jgi:hypothetical protein
MDGNEFKQVGLQIVIYDRLDNPIWTLRTGSGDDLYLPNYTLAEGEEITLNGDTKYTVSDVQLVKRLEGWQVNIRVD